jgi:uncharacterized protein YyaL (SSP411 family)
MPQKNRGRSVPNWIRALILVALLPGPNPVSGESVAGVETAVNRLAGERSPYLLQHAHQPVEWHPWGEEAFQKALREDKPIFLSIGYSTCHWCHVMARESFDDPQTAKLLNASFVCIKVDREERPDVDRVYMTYVQATTGGGGWPLSVFLTPTLHPFLGGTYYPPENRDGRPGFPTVLHRISEAWKTQRADIEAHAREVISKLNEPGPEPEAKPADPKALAQSALGQYVQSFDEEHGGFGRAPKFPRPVNLRLLLRLAADPGLKQQDRKLASGMVLHTLRKMAGGGLRDHLGGGFHRYSTDPLWQVPHFEKMLYDQAQLAQAYLEAFQFSKDPFFGEVARECLDYVLRQLTSEEGGFFSAEDADSSTGGDAHAEGAFYVWTAAEIDRILGGSSLKGRIFSGVYGVQPFGNVPESGDPRGELKDQNVLFRALSDPQAAERFQTPVQEVRALLAEARADLGKAQAARPRPHRDDKILTAWNGLMISAFAQGARVFGSEEYLQAARKAARFLQTNLVRDGHLLRSYRGSAGTVAGFAEDYAFLIRGLLDLYEADFDASWLAWALQLQDHQEALFLDPKTGAYFSTQAKSPAILLRLREEYDGAEPSANSVAALNLLHLGRLFDDRAFQTRADRVAGALSGQLAHAPTSLPLLLAALHAGSLPHIQVVVAGNRNDPATQALLRTVNARFLPEKVLILADDSGPWLRKKLPLLENFKPVEGKPAAYVCKDFVCKPPALDPRALEALLTDPPTPSR